MNDDNRTTKTESIDVLSLVKCVDFTDSSDNWSRVHYTVVRIVTDPAKGGA